MILAAKRAMPPGKLVGAVMLLWGVTTLCDVTTGNRCRRAKVARMLRAHQERGRRILGRQSRRMLWWWLRSDTGQAITALMAVVACVVGALLIAL